MKTKKKVLILIDWFYPAYKAGGPIKSVYHIIQTLGIDYDFHIVTSNTDIGNGKISIEPNKWIDEKNYSIIYLSSNKQSIKVYKQIFEEVQADLIYFNNMFSLNFGIKPLWLLKGRSEIKQLIAPRGMLGEGALKLKPLKKRLFLFFAKMFLFDQHLIWHATSEQEEKEIKQVIGPRSQIKIAKNLTSTPHLRSVNSSFKSSNELNLVFISRISEKKNLLFALKIIELLKHLEGLKLDIYGPIENDNYWKQCETIIKADSRITYKGLLKPYQIHSTLQQYHFFVLPTLHENFGHAIAEAMNAGVPVMISQFTPWQSLDKYGVGFDLELEDESAWIVQLENVYVMDSTKYSDMVASCFDYANRFIVNSTNLAANKNLFLIE